VEQADFPALWWAARQPDRLARLSVQSPVVCSVLKRAM
jgi:hypothetical protein